ncbi:MAG TPA: DNA helicase UvrBC, partial [Pirellulaceae bacterium]|nr:DNA helicase UvrBC [Pirellulaceae bacterium]
MSHPEHLDELLRDWSYEPQALGVRIVTGSDGRDVLQMRIDMGVLQLEMEGRPDGARPKGF